LREQAPAGHGIRLRRHGQTTATRKYSACARNQTDGSKPISRGDSFNREIDHDQAELVGSDPWHRYGVRRDPHVNQVIAGKRAVTLLAFAGHGRGQSRTAALARERCRCSSQSLSARSLRHRSRGRGRRSRRCRSRRDGGLCRGRRLVDLSGVGALFRVRRGGRGAWPRCDRHRSGDRPAMHDLDERLPLVLEAIGPREGGTIGIALRMRQDPQRSPGA